MTAEQERAEWIALALRRAHRLDREVLEQLAALLPPTRPASERGAA